MTWPCSARRYRRPQGRDLGRTTGALHPVGVRHLGCGQGDRRGGGAAGHCPPRRPLGSAAGARAGRLPHRDGSPPGAGPAVAACRGGLGEGGRGRCRSRRGEAPGDRCPRPGTRGPRAASGERPRPLEGVERLEAAWGRASAALERFDADGRLNDRTRAEAEIAAALKDLTGPEWSKVRNFLTDPRSLAFLDRMHRRLVAAEPRAEWREAMAWRWWLRHGRVGRSDAITECLRGVVRGRDLDAEERPSYERVAAVLGDTVRASSAVECMNSVLRMQQSRHRRMTQPMLDLKRLYWNCRPFRSGPRKDACPYRALGLVLPTYDLWELLHTDPARLTQQLSTPGNAD